MESCSAKARQNLAEQLSGSWVPAKGRVRPGSGKYLSLTPVGDFVPPGAALQFLMTHFFPLALDW